MILFNNYKEKSKYPYQFNFAIFDKIEAKDILGLTAKLEHGINIYDNFNNLRLFIKDYKLLVMNMNMDTSTVGILKCPVVEIPLGNPYDEDYGCEHYINDTEVILRKVFEPIFEKGLNLNILFDSDYFEKNLVAMDIVKREYMNKKVLFNPIKSTSIDLPQIAMNELDNKLIAKYIINSDEIIVECFKPKNSVIFSYYEKMLFANRLFFSKGIRYNTTKNNTLTDGFDITFTVNEEDRFKYRVVYKKTVEVDKLINMIMANKAPIKTLTTNQLVPKVIKAIITTNPYNIEKISSMSLTDEDYKLAVSLDGGVLAFIPEDRKTIELCEIAVKNEQYAEHFVPKHLNKLKMAI